MKLKTHIWCLGFAFLLVLGCKSPFDRTRDASSGGPLGKFGVAPGFVVFSNELKTGGGAFEYPGGENQSLSFTDVSNPLSGRSIRYIWNGQPVTNAGCSPNPTHNFAGFDLMHTIFQSDYNSTPGRDLRQAGYTKVTFASRGSLSTDTVLKIEVAGPGSSNACASAPSPCLWLSVNGADDDGVNSAGCGHATFTGGWQEYTIPISNKDLASIKDFFKATLIFNDPFPGNTAPGQGGTVYFDQIVYNP